MTWETPKTNWADPDGIGYDDLNRIEGNILGVRNATVRKVQGFGYLVYNLITSYDGIVAVQPGSCYSSDGFPIWQNTEIRKNLTTWALGSGNDKGGMASAVTVAANTWYYIYVLLNSTTGAIDVMFDDDPGGANIPAGTFDKKRYVGAFKTRLAGGDASFDICPMYAIGDTTFYDPTGMYNDRANDYGPYANDLYSLIELGTSPNFALPARLVTAKLNAYSDADEAFGLTSNYFGDYDPGGTGLENAGDYNAEALCKEAAGSMDFDIVVDTDRKIWVALKDSGSATLWIAVRGFHDERLI